MSDFARANLETRTQRQQAVLNNLAHVPPGVGVPVDWDGRQHLSHGALCDASLGAGETFAGYVGNPLSLTVGNVMFENPRRFFNAFDHPCVITQTSNTSSGLIATQPRSTSMMREFLSADFQKLGLDELMAHSAFAKMVVAEFEDYGLDVPEDLAKRQRTIGREIQRAIEAEIDRLDAEEKELQKREDRRKDVLAKRERLQQALGQ